MLVVCRDGGLLRLLLLVVWLHLIKRWKASFPPPGFLGAASTLSVVIAHKPVSLKSIRLNGIQNILGAPRWRLTLEFRTSLRAQPLTSYGSKLGKRGSVWGEDGEGSLVPPI